MNASPTTLHAGGAVSVSGNCSGTDVKFRLYEGWKSTRDLPGFDYVKIGTIPVGEGNEINWTGEVVIPAGTAPGTYTLYGLCDSEQIAYSYDNIEITVLADETTDTTATTVTSAPTTTVAPAVAPSATPAAPVTAKPTYTG